MNKVILAVIVCRGIKHKGKVFYPNYVSIPITSLVYKKNTENILSLRRWVFFLRLELMQSADEVIVEFFEKNIY